MTGNEKPEAPIKAVKKPAGRLKKFGFALVAFLIFLVLLDVAAGLYLRTSWFNTMVAHDYTLIHRMRPGYTARTPVGQMTPELWNDSAPVVTISTNAEGYRGPLVKGPGESGEFRVVCMGDSITFGLDIGDGQTYPALLEKMLEERMPGRKVTVINGGAISYSSRQGLYLFREKFLALEPDVVVWSFGFNDQSRLPIPGYRDVDLVSLGPGRDPDTGAFVKRLLLWSYRRPSLTVAHRAIMPLLWKTRAAGLMERIGEMESGNAASMESEEDYEDARVPPAEYRLHILEMIGMAETNDFKLVVLNLFGTKELYRDQAFSYCGRDRVECLDMAKPFAEMALGGELTNAPSFEADFAFYKKGIRKEALEKFPMLFLTTDNLHPNNIGQRIIARALADVIAAKSR